MKAAACAAVLCVAALGAGCGRSSAGLEHPTVLNGSVEQPNADRLGRMVGFSVDFVSADRGFLATQGDRLLRTSDGGKSWSAAAARIDHLAGIDFVSARQGFALTGHNVLITQDAGDTWRRVHRFSAGDGPGWNLVFVDAAHGWVALGERSIYRTSDSGRTWVRRTFPCKEYDHPVGPSFIDKSNGYVVCGGQPATDMQSKALYVTNDGGNTWRLELGSTLFSRAPKRGLPSIGGATGVDFRSARSGLLVANREGIDRTDDGGRTWRTVLWTDDEDDVSDVAWPTPSRIFAVVFHAGVLRSDDGGVRWRRVYGGAAPPPDGPIVFSSGTDGIGFGAETVSGGPKAVFGTRDGGSTWSRAGQVAPLDSAQQVFRFGRIVLVTDGTTLLRSEDEGRHWRKLTVLSGRRYGWFSFVSADVGFRTDDRHRLFRTDDGGSTWKLVAQKTPELQGVVFVSSSEAFVIDYGPPPPDDGMKHSSPRPRLLHSEDGGKHWKVVEAPLEILTRIYSLDARHWWLFANANCTLATPCTSGQVLRTADGGRHWDLIRLPGTLDAQFATFVSPQVGFAGSPATGLYRTDDGGVTWSYVYQGEVSPRRRS
jgi:photosystem II stability/assembly factor-like uncharacterized protein